MSLSALCNGPRSLLSTLKTLDVDTLGATVTLEDALAEVSGWTEDTLAEVSGWTEETLAEVTFFFTLSSKVDLDSYLILTTEDTKSSYIYNINIIILVLILKCH